MICCHLRFIKRLRVDFLIESFGYSSALENAVLAEEKPVFEGKFGE